MIDGIPRILYKIRHAVMNQTIQAEEVFPSQNVNRECHPGINQGVPARNEDSVMPYGITRPQ